MAEASRSEIWASGYFICAKEDSSRPLCIRIAANDAPASRAARRTIAVESTCMACTSLIVTFFADKWFSTRVEAREPLPAIASSDKKELSTPVFGAVLTLY